MYEAKVMMVDVIATGVLYFTWQKKNEQKRGNLHKSLTLILYNIHSCASYYVEWAISNAYMVGRR